MKVSRLLIAAVLVSACSSEPRESREAAPEPAPTPQATTGEEPIGGEVRRPLARRAQPRPSVAEREERKSADGPVAAAAATAGVNSDAAVLQDFRTRVAAYMDVRKQAADEAPELEQTEDPADINAAQEALATRIRARRANAKHGDIFTLEIRAAIRRLLAPELKGEDGRDARAMLKDDAPPPSAIPFKVNGKYPQGQPLPTLPANLLLNLPTLPDPLEYRIIGKHLVLLDTDANLIVDYVPNAIR